MADMKMLILNTAGCILVSSTRTAETIFLLFIPTLLLQSGCQASGSDNVTRFITPNAISIATADGRPRWRQQEQLHHSSFSASGRQKKRSPHSQSAVSTFAGGPPGPQSLEQTGAHGRGAGARHTAAMAFSCKKSADARKPIRRRIPPSTGEQTRERTARISRQTIHRRWREKRRSKYDMVMAKMDLSEDLRALTLYLAGHKYYGFDPRKGNELTWKYREKGFYKSFPRPSLKFLHDDVESACGEGLVNCVRRLATVARGSYALKDTDLGQEIPSNATEYHPFKTPLDLFRFRTSATYYLCWHALQKREIFKSYMKGRKCLEGLKEVLEPFGQDRNIIEFRADDVPYQCAILAFCPDPCYGRLTQGRVLSSEFLDRDPGNPCRGLKDKTCAWDFKNNKNFEDLKRNRFNITCECSKERAGFHWNSKYHLCVDTDECLARPKDCQEKDDQVCQNTVGSFVCLCRRGYVRDPVSKKCKEHYPLPRPRSSWTRPFDRKRFGERPETSMTFLRRQFERFLGISSARAKSTPIPELLLLCFAVFILSVAEN